MIHEELENVVDTLTRPYEHIGSKEGLIGWWATEGDGRLLRKRKDADTCLT